ncbi:MAG: glutathione S-transferase family protein [Alphaproteobacteria bacterium]|nr:glutathione S-transferase family protein [Alphaproteobacteria bacterium]
MAVFELYHGEISTCSQKVRVTLAEKGQAWTSHHLDLRKAEQHRPEYLKLNPNGVVPTLVVDGVPIIESSVIIQYLDELIPAPPLRPGDPLGRANMRLWMKRLDEEIHPLTGVLSSSIAFRFEEGHEAQIKTMINPAKRARKMESFKLGVEAPLFRKALAGYDKLLGDMEKVIAAEGYLAGGVYSLADISYIGYAVRLHHLGLQGLFEGRPGLQQWYATITARPAVKLAIDDFAPDHSLDLMSTHGAESWPRIRAILGEVRGTASAEMAS